MLKQTLVVAFALLGSNSMAQGSADAPVSLPGSASDAVTKAMAARTCALPEIVDQAPLEQMSGSDLMTVPVAVNGKTKQFLLDIGLRKPSEVSPSLMAELSLPEIPKTNGYISSPGPSTGGATFGQTSFGGMGLPY